MATEGGGGEFRVAIGALAVFFSGRRRAGVVGVGVGGGHDY